MVIKSKKQKKQAWDATLRWYERSGYLVDWSAKRPVHMVNHDKEYGRAPKGWHIHHINHIKADNRPSNLIAIPQLVHHWAHQGTDSTNFFPREVLDKWIQEYRLKPDHWRTVELHYQHLTIPQLEQHLSLLQTLLDHRRAGREIVRKWKTSSSHEPVSEMEMTRIRELASSKDWKPL